MVSPQFVIRNDQISIHLWGDNEASPLFKCDTHFPAIINRLCIGDCYAGMNDIAVDQEIIDRIRAGDKAACARCIEEYGSAIYRLAFRLMQNEADAEDVVQETFLNAFRAINSFEGRSGLGTWLYRIAHNNAMMRLRRSKPDALSLEKSLDDGEEGYPVPRQLYDWCCLPEQDLQTAEVKAELVRAVNELPPILRSVFTLREFEGLSTRDTAVALDVSEEVVKTRLHRARLRLRETLSAYFSDGFQSHKGNSDGS